MKKRMISMAWKATGIVRYPVAAVAGMICILSGGLMMAMNPSALDDLLQ